MNRLILFLLAVSCWGQSSLSFFWGTISGTTGGATVVLNDANDAVGVVFVASSTTSVSGLALYSTARATANVDSLIAEVYEVQGSTIGAIVTYTDASDVVNFTNNQLVNGDRIKFAPQTTLPAGLSADTVYYVCNRTATTIQVDDDGGCGSVVTDYSGSSGTQYLAEWLASSTTFTPSPVTAATWIDFSSFSSHTLVSGQKYAVFMRNTEAVPGTDSVTMVFLNGEGPSNPQGLNLSGVTSATAASRAFPAASMSGNNGYVTLADSTKHGSPVYAVAQSTVSRINGTREVGARFTTTVNASIVLAGMGFQLRNAAGTTYPTSFDLKLYSIGSTTDTVVATCTAKLTVVSGVHSTMCWLSATATLSANTNYRLVAMATSNAGDSSNYWIMNYFSFRSGETWGNSFSPRLTYCAATCTTTANWTDSTTDTAPLMLFLDTTTPFASTGSGTTGGAFVVTQ